MYFGRICNHEKKDGSSSIGTLYTLSLAACGSGSASAPASSDGCKAPASKEADAAPKKGSADAITLRWSEVNGEDYGATVGAKEFASKIEELSGGQIKVELYLNGTLGNEKECMQGIQMGTLDIFRGNASSLSNTEQKRSVCQVFHSCLRIWISLRLWQRAAQDRSFLTQ